MFRCSRVRVLVAAKTIVRCTRRTMRLCRSPRRARRKETCETASPAELLKILKILRVPVQHSSQRATGRDPQETLHLWVAASHAGEECHPPVRARSRAETFNDALPALEQHVFALELECPRIQLWVRLSRPFADSARVHSASLPDSAEIYAGAEICRIYD